MRIRPSHDASVVPMIIQIDTKIKRWNDWWQLIWMEESHVAVYKVYFFGLIWASADNLQVHLYWQHSLRWYISRWIMRLCLTMWSILWPLSCGFKQISFTLSMSLEFTAPALAIFLSGPMDRFGGPGSSSWTIWMTGLWINRKYVF